MQGSAHIKPDPTPEPLSVPDWTRGRRLLFFVCLGVFAALATGCSGVQVYNFGGEGRGQAFHVPVAAVKNDSAIVQSWIAYSLARSTCKLEIGGPLPSANDSFDCEFRPRRVLAERWAGRIDSPDTDEYLDEVAQVRRDGFLKEYVWHFFRQRDWVQPEGLAMARFQAYRRSQLVWHRPKTRVIGYWTQGRAADSGLAQVR